LRPAQKDTPIAADVGDRSEGHTPGVIHCSSEAKLVLTVQATGSPSGGAKMTLPADRLCLFHEKSKIKVERPFFYAVSG